MPTTTILDVHLSRMYLHSSEVVVQFLGAVIGSIQRMPSGSWFAIPSVLSTTNKCRYFESTDLAIRHLINGHADEIVHWEIQI